MGKDGGAADVENLSVTRVVGGIGRLSGIGDERPQSTNVGAALSLAETDAFLGLFFCLFVGEEWSPEVARGFALGSTVTPSRYWHHSFGLR